MVEELDSGMQTLLEVNNGPNGSTHVPAFLAKLWKIVDDPNTKDLICWSELGNSFLIKNQSKFARELLPLYYKHNNMASFVRQLNMYGFHKVVSVEQGGLRTDKDEMEFAHPFFLRGSESTLELIKRKLPAAKLEESRGTRTDNINKVSVQRAKAEKSKVLQDVRQMKGRQDSMDSRLLAVKRENEALWRELSVLRQKHAKQQQIVSKLLQFLVGMMSSQSHRLGFKRRMPMSLPLMLNDIDGLKMSKRNKTGGELVGPVIRDVTDFINTPDRLYENQRDYLSGETDLDSQPKVDSPGSSGMPDRSPYAESVYPMSPYDDPDMLLSVDPMKINPSVEIVSQPPVTQVPAKRNNKQTPIKSKGTKKPVAGQKKATSTASFVPAEDQVTPPEASSSILPDMGVGTSTTQVAHTTQLPTVMYLPGTETPVQVVLSLPEPTPGVTDNGKVTTTYVAVPNMSIPADSSKSVAALTKQTNPLASSPHSIELSIPSPKMSKENAETERSTEVVLSSPDNTLSREDFDDHLDDVQSGLDNLRELLKQDQQYNMDPNTLLTLFGNEDLFGIRNSDHDVVDQVKETSNASNNAGEVVSYNPNLYELADDDFFDYQNSGGFLDDELESMLTTDREKLKKGDLKTDISSIS